LLGSLIQLPRSQSVIPRPYFIELLDKISCTLGLQPRNQEESETESILTSGAAEDQEEMTDHDSEMEQSKSLTMFDCALLYFNAAGIPECHFTPPPGHEKHLS
jgi:hypothetical protein